jgi:hypothetical protein
VAPNFVDRIGNPARLSDLYGISPTEGLTIADSRPFLARVGTDHRIHVTEKL